MSFDFGDIWKSKRTLRERLAACPIAEKLRLLDLMRERSLTIRAARPRRRATVHEQPPRYGKRPNL